MNKALEKFTLIFSKGPQEVVSLIKAYSKKQKRGSLPPVSKVLWKKIQTYKKQLETEGLPPFLEIAEVNPYIQTGVFLKPNAKPLKPNTFIGLYTGDYELVFIDETKDNHYAYDVAPGLKLKKEQLPFVRSNSHKPTVKEEYSVQTNAAYEGNFTRYINHSSVDTNIEAFTKKLPDGSVEVFLFTAKTIKPGEQLLSNYGGQYWAVLPIIPEPVSARTYRLNKAGKVVKNKEEVIEQADVDEKLLKSLRVAPTLETSHLSKPFRSFLSKKRIRYATLALEHKIEDFEEDILERGLPLKYEMKKSGAPFLYDVHVRFASQRIKKGSFIGVLGGTWRLLDHKASDKIDSGIEHKGQHLFLDPSETSNFTRFFTKEKGGNLKVTLYKKRGPNGLYLVITAARDIRPGEKLSLLE